MRKLTTETGFIAAYATDDVPALLAVHERHPHWQFWGCPEAAEFMLARPDQNAHDLRRGEWTRLDVADVEEFLEE